MFGHASRLLVGTWTPVSRLAYVVAGVALMALKFVLERLLFQMTVHEELTLDAFLTPFFVHRADLLRNDPTAAAFALALALPFLWIGLSMSARRAYDAGLPPILGFLFLIPGVHYLLIAALSILPHRDPKPLSGARPPTSSLKEFSPVLAVLKSIAIASVIGIGMFAVNVYLLRSYGSGLFLATPFVMGMTASVSYFGAKTGASVSAPSPGIRAPAPLATSGRVSLGQPPVPPPPPNQMSRGARTGLIVGLSIFSLLMVATLLLASGREGLGCLAMAAIPAAFVAIMGGFIGYAIGSTSIAASLERQRRQNWGLILLLPLASGIGNAVEKPHEIVVTTSVIVDAPPSVVWENVVSFPDLAPPTEWIFRHGISYPLRARIEGRGVGAIRRCQFSTGDFVEPITTWDEPTLLAFDVVENPPPMREWNVFWDDVEAPHLHGFMHSRRGQFRLVPEADGTKTRLEGTTVYQLEIYPSAYWQLWSDKIIHTIHQRVLDHIKLVSESSYKSGDAR